MGEADAVVQYSDILYNAAPLIIIIIIIIIIITASS
jgi:hypothetical protein